MNIAIIGYGKMGKTIERLAKDRGHQIVLKINSKNADLVKVEHLTPLKIDVAIEFTTPDLAYHNITTFIKAGIKVVSGTTAWLDRWDEVLTVVEENKGSFIYASNFSIGVNLFFAMNQRLAEMMNDYPQYDVDIKEIHHTSKLDSPSGTAVTLAQGVTTALDRKDKWILKSDDRQATKDEISIDAIRKDPAPGTHYVSYRSAIDEIEIIHTAKSRDGFAMGALIAAEYLSKNQGVYTMKDVLGL